MLVTWLPLDPTSPTKAPCESTHTRRRHADRRRATQEGLGTDSLTGRRGVVLAPIGRHFEIRLAPHWKPCGGREKRETRQETSKTYRIDYYAPADAIRLPIACQLMHNDWPQVLCFSGFSLVLPSLTAGQPRLCSVLLPVCVFVRLSSSSEVLSAAPSTSPGTGQWRLQRPRTRRGAGVTVGPSSRTSSSPLI